MFPRDEQLQPPRHPTPFLLAAAIFPAVTRQGHCSARSRGLTPSSASSYREAENSPRAIRIIWGSEVTRWSDVQGRYARVARSTCAGHDRLTAGMYVVLEQERELGRSSHALTYLFRVLGQSVVHLMASLTRSWSGILKRVRRTILGILIDCFCGLNVSSVDVCIVEIIGRVVILYMKLLKMLYYRSLSDFR